ncbi:MAG: hypothetical protein KBH06_05290 [Spirochaetes bacterium]|nr:hypothetical protein [Spirochaetota bacterium]
MKKITVVLCIILFSVLNAKRIPSAEVKPLKCGKYLFRAVHFPKANPEGFLNGGYIEIREIESDRLVKGMFTYHVKISEELERDVQSVFITELKFDSEKKRIVLRNSAKQIFYLDPETFEISQ